jgi:cytochrome c5
MNPATPPSNDSKKVIHTALSVIAGSIAAILAIVLIAQFSISAYQSRARDAKTDPAMAAAAIAARIKPVAEVSVTDPNAPKILKTGQQVYDAVCAACHGAGLLNAPKFGDKALWAKPLAQGYETLVEHAIKGIRAMPAKGGAADLEEVEVARAVVHMANNAGASFKEPATK